MSNPILSNDPVILRKALDGTVRETTDNLLGGIEELLCDQSRRRASLWHLPEVDEYGPASPGDLHLAVDAHHVAMLAGLYQRWSALLT